MKLDSLNRAKNTPVCHNGTNKSTISNPKNQVYEAHKSKIKTLTEKKAQEMYKDKTFGDEYQGVYFVTGLLKVVFSFASACTVFVAIHWALKPLLGALIAMSLALVICTILEVLKSGIWGKLSKNILKYKEFPFALAAAAILFNFSSVGGSIFGAWQMPAMAEQATHATPLLIDIDSVGKSFNSKLLTFDKIMSEQLKAALSTTSNTAKKLASKNIALQTNQKGLILTAQTKAIEYAKEQNKATLKAHKEKVKIEKVNIQEQLYANQVSCISVAVSFELMLILCLTFISYYLYRVEIDRVGVSSEQPQTTLSDNSNVSQCDIDNQQKGHSAPTAKVNPRKIGFGNNNDTDTDEKTHYTLRPNVTADTNQTATGVPNGICDNPKCGKSFTRKSVLKKHCSSKCKRQKSYDKINKKSNS